MNTANPNSEDRAAAAAQRRYFPDSYREDALESGDRDRIFRSLEGSESTVDASDVIGFIRAVGKLSANLE